MSVCVKCHAGCCRSLMLMITGYDALRIARDLALPPESFTQFVPLGESQAEAMRGSWALIRFADSSGPLKDHVLTLKKVPSTLMPTTTRCTFLQEWPRAQPDESSQHPGGRVAARCGIYGSRPIMCRTYPALFDPAEGPLVANRASMQAASGDDALCPQPWTAEMYAPDPTGTVHDLVIERYEFEFFGAAVAAWNAEPRPRAEFFEFMMAVYTNRLRTAPPSYAAAETKVEPLTLGDIFPQYRAFRRKPAQTP